MHFKENINKNDNCNDENYHNDDNNNNDRTRRKPLIFNHKLNYTNGNQCYLSVVGTPAKM